MNKPSIKSAFSDDPEVIRLLEARENADMMKKLMEKTSTKSPMELFAEMMKGEKGEQGEQGIQGETGKDGVVRNFTPEEISVIIEHITPKKGKDYVDGKNGKDGHDGQSIQGQKGDKGKDGVEIKPQQVADKLNTLEGVLEPRVIKGYLKLDDIVKEIKVKKLLELRDIKGARLDMNDQRWHGGGIQNVTGYITAGANITITGSGTLIDPYIITGTGGGGSGFQKPTGIVNGINTIFTFGTAPNAISVDEGRVIQKVSSDGTVNWTGTAVVTLSIAPNNDIFGVC